MIKGHGGNIYDLARRLGCRPADIVDLSSNVNPLGPPPGLGDYLSRNMDAIAALPEDPNGIWVTGPSKTADVEGILIQGVHGPGIQGCLLV